VRQAVAWLSHEARDYQLRDRVGARWLDPPTKVTGIEWAPPENKYREWAAPYGVSFGDVKSDWESGSTPVRRTGWVWGSCRVGGLVVEGAEAVVVAVATAGVVLGEEGLAEV